MTLCANTCRVPCLGKACVLGMIAARSVARVQPVAYALAAAVKFHSPAQWFWTVHPKCRQKLTVHAVSFLFARMRARTQQGRGERRSPHGGRRACSHAQDQRPRSHSWQGWARARPLCGCVWKPKLRQPARQAICAGCRNSMQAQARSQRPGPLFFFRVARVLRSVPMKTVAALSRVETDHGAVISGCAPAVGTRVWHLIRSQSIAARGRL